MAFSPDGELVATSSRDGTARVWNARTGTAEHVLEGHRSDVTSVAFSPGGKLVLTAGRDGDARLWNAATGAPRPPMRWHFGAVSDASFSPDGNWIVTAGPATAQIWRTGSQTPLLRFGLGGHTRPLTSAVFDPGSRVVLTAGLDGTVRTYRCSVCGGIGELLPICRGSARRDGIGFLASGTRIVLEVEAHHHSAFGRMVDLAEPGGGVDGPGSDVDLVQADLSSHAFFGSSLYRRHQQTAAVPRVPNTAWR